MVQTLFRNDDAKFKIHNAAHIYCTLSFKVKEKAGKDQSVWATANLEDTCLSSSVPKSVIVVRSERLGGIERFLL